MTAVGLLERAPLLARLEAARAGAAAGTGALVLLGGEAGAGKSALLAAFVAALPPSAVTLPATPPRPPTPTRPPTPARPPTAATLPAIPALLPGGGEGGSIEVRTGACDAIATPRPLGALRDIARPGSEVDAALAAGRPAGDVFALLLAELRTAPGLTVLVIEDVHWADEATLDLLRYLARRIADVSVLVLVTYRDDELGPAAPLRIVLGDLASMPTAQRLHVPRLSPDAVAAIAAEHDLDAAALYRTTGGNPFFVSEVVASAPDELPDTVRDAVLARCARLSPAARALLDAVSVVASRVPHWVLVELDAAELPGLDECISSGVLVEADEPGAVRFRHELARRAVESALPVGRRLALHNRLLDLLRVRTPAVDPVWIVHHAIAAGDDGAVVEYGALAAERASSLGAHREAAALLAEVLIRARDLPVSYRAELLGRRSYECYLTDELEPALEARTAALALWRSIGDVVRIGDSLRWLSRLSWFLARRAESERSAREAVEVLETAAPTRELALAYSNRAQLAMLAYDEPSASQWGGRAIDLGEQLDDIEVLVHALNNVGTARAHVRHGDGLAMLERSLALSLQHGLVEHAARAYTNLLAVTVEIGEVDAARRYADEGLTYCADRDVEAWWVYMTGWRARLRLETGEWALAADDAHHVLSRPSASPVSRVTALVVVGLLRARRGDPGASDALDEALSIARVSGEVQRLAPVALAQAELAWLAGRGAPPLLADTLRLVRHVHEPFVIRRIVTWARRLAVDPADWSALEPAAASVTGYVGPYEQALAAVDGSDLVALRVAADTMRSLGATAGLQRVSERLRELGAAGARPARASTVANPAGLTAREATVAELVVSGLSNAGIAQRLVLSQRTVDHHVSAVLRKVGVARRADVGPALDRLTAGAPSSQ